MIRIDRSLGVSSGAGGPSIIHDAYTAKYFASCYPVSLVDVWSTAITAILNERSGLEQARRTAAFIPQAPVVQVVQVLQVFRRVMDVLLGRYKQ